MSIKSVKGNKGNIKASTMPPNERARSVEVAVTKPAMEKQNRAGFASSAPFGKRLHRRGWAPL